MAVHRISTRFASFALALLMVLSLTAHAAYDADSDLTWEDMLHDMSDAAAGLSSFSDVQPGSWYYSDVLDCVRSGAVAGFGDGTFRPNDNVTYAQLVVMLTRAFYSEQVEAVTDSSGKPWYYANMKVLTDLNIHNGTDIKNQGGWPVVLVANNNINRYEMARLLHNILGQFNKGASNEEKDAAQANIKDWNQIPAPVDGKTNYKVCVKNCYALGIITGMSDGTFSGTQNMTRAQACTVMNRMSRLINGETPVQPAQPQQSDKKLANGKDITIANVQAILDELRREYPFGTSWTSRETDPNTKYYAAGDNSVDIRNVTNRFKCTGGGLLNTQYACGGFMAMVSDRIFGQTGFPAREVTSLNDVRIGDIIIYTPNTNGFLEHVGIVALTGGSCEVTGLSGAKSTAWIMATCEGNFGNTVIWPDENQTHYWYQKYLGDTFHIYTRYPD